jgi:hypothetical protein
LRPFYLPGYLYNVIGHNLPLINLISFFNILKELLKH